jgi:hypothetical protein
MNMNINLKELINLGQVVLLKEGSGSNRTLRFGKVICIPVDPHRGGINITIPLIIDLTESMQYISKDETWLCIENTPEDFKKFEFPDGFKVGLLTQAIKQNNPYIYPATELAKDEGLLEELHKALLNELIEIGFSFQQEPDESGVKVVRQVYILPTDLIPLGIYVIEERCINESSSFYYIHPSIFSMNYLPRYIGFDNITEVADYYMDENPTSVSIAIQLGNYVRRLTQEEILHVSKSLNI